MLVCEKNFKIYMNNNCKHLKQGFYGKITCKKKKRLISICDCKNCKFKEYENAIMYNNKRKITLKKKTYKQSKKEKTRFSIIYKDLTKCAKCGSTYNVQKNEVYEGSKRGISIKYGFVIPLCETCHNRFHSDRQFALYYKKMFQKEFEKTHTRDEFTSIFYRNYLD